MFDFSRENLDREFPVRKNLVYLNHAAVAPLPARVARAITDFTREASEYGALHWKKWYRHYDEMREKAARFVGAEPQEISFLPSTSYGLNLVAQGISWRTGDSVLGDDMEFPANVYPWMNLADRGVEYFMVRHRDGRMVTEDIADRIDPTTRVIAISWVAFHNGAVSPLSEIGRLCRERNILFVVDAIQGLGTMPLDVKALAIDVLVADGHKFLYGTEGCAIFYASEKARRRIGTPWAGWWNVKSGASFLDYRLEFFEGGRRFEPGSLPTVQLFGLGAALDLLTEIGMETARDRLSALTGALKTGLADGGWTIATPPGSVSAIVAAVPPDGDARKAYNALLEKGIVTSAREGAVRFAPHVGNDESEIERVLEAVRAIANGAGTSR